MDEKQPIGFTLSTQAKIEYLSNLIGKIHKILHLFDERQATGYSPQPFIGGQLFEINAANGLFDGRLVPILVKLKGLYDDCDTVKMADVKKQVFECCKILNNMIAEIKASM